MKDNIILEGFMGCGKSTIGIKLSYQLRLTLIDTDKWIERRQKMPITEIFAKQGEAAFREMETECIRELLTTAEHQVISLGGGLPMKQENRELLGKLGKVFYLKVTPEAVYERIGGDTTRPLLQVENPLERITKLLTERDALYRECADYVLDTSGKSPEEVLLQIREQIEK